MKIELNKVYLCITQEDANAFMRDCNEQGIKWRSGQMALPETSAWQRYQSTTCYYVCQERLSYGDLIYFKTEHPELEIVRYAFETDEERAARDLAWRQLMQIEEHPK